MEVIKSGRILGGERSQGRSRPFPRSVLSKKFSAILSA